MSEGLFDDLEDLPHDEIEEKSEDLDRQLRSLEDEFNSLRQDRRSQVDLVKSLRTAVGGIEEADSERKGLLRRFHEIKKKADKDRDLRDKVNISIPPPATVLEDWMGETHTKLTTIDNDLTTVPTLNRELDSFRRFFELQAAVVRKREAEVAHARYVSQIEDLRKVTTKLDATKKTRKATADGATEGTDIESDKVTRGEIRKMSRRINGIDKRLDSIKLLRKDLRKEAGRLRSYLKITGGRGPPIRLSDVKERASTGGSLNTNELTALLDSGSLLGIASESETTESKDEPQRRGRSGNKGKRRLGVTRGGPRRGSSASKRE
jgi:chromosome segregation ATPase